MIKLISISLALVAVLIVTYFAIPIYWQSQDMKKSNWPAAIKLPLLTAEISHHAPQSYTTTKLSSRIKESSGLAISTNSHPLSYHINDSGNPATVLLSIDHGHSIKTETAFSSESQDPEDLALGPCGSSQCLFVGDMGDNLRQRTEKTIYYAPELQLSQPGVRFSKINYVYQDNVRLDAEALVVDPKTGDIYIFSKSSPTYVFRIAGKVINRGDKATVAQLVATLQLSYLTAADLDAKDRLLLLTSKRVLQMPFSSLINGLEPASSRVIHYRVPALSQQESVAWHLDGKGFTFTSEATFGSGLTPLRTTVITSSKPQP